MLETLGTFVEGSFVEVDKLTVDSCFEVGTIEMWMLKTLNTLVKGSCFEQGNLIEVDKFVVKCSSVEMNNLIVEAVSEVKCNQYCYYPNTCCLQGYVRFHKVWKWIRKKNYCRVCLLLDLYRYTMSCKPKRLGKLVLVHLNKH
jgi:hypothetical protein